MRLKQIESRDVSRSSNNLELGLSSQERIHPRYCSSTPSDLQKSKDMRVTTNDAFLQILQHNDFHKKSQRNPSNYNTCKATNHPVKSSSAFDRRKSNAIRRRIHPQIKCGTVSSINESFPETNPKFTQNGKTKRQLKSGARKGNFKKGNVLKSSFFDRSLSTNENESDKISVQPNVEIRTKKHLGVTQNLSWSPPTLNKEVPYRPRLYSSNLPQISKLSRSIRIRKWVEGKRVSDPLEDEDQIKDSDRRLDTKLQRSKIQQITNKGGVVRLPELQSSSENVRRESPLPAQTNNRARKTSESTVRYRRKLEKEPGIAESIGSESFAYRNKFQDIPIESSCSGWSNQSQAEVQTFRLNALKDKLSAKGQPLTVLNLLENEEPGEALKIAREGHSRVRMDVCFLWACMHGDADLATVFLVNGANPEARDAEGFSALHLAAESGSEEIVETIIKEGARVKGPSFWDNRGERTPLMLASKHGYADIVLVLVQQGADVDAGLHTRSRTALHYAVQSGSTECVQILIEAGATINPLLLYSETPLHIAVEEGHSDVVDVLLKAGADVRASRGHSKTACLHISAEGNYYHITHQLLKAKANPNQEDSNGQTALHVATRSQCYDTVQILLNYKANPNVKDNEGKTPLHTGIFKGSRNFECLKLLLESKGDPNIPDNAGYTPLHLAALNNAPYCVKLLLKHDADMTQTTKGGITALNIILRRTPEVITQIQESLDSAINFVEHDQQFERDGQIHLDFRILLAGSEGGPECRLLSCFIKESQKAFLKHPLCETFLFLKWLRVRSFFVFNAVFYMFLVIAITQYFYIVFTSTSEHHHKLANETKFNYLTQVHHHVESNHTHDGNNTNSSDAWFHFKFEKDCLVMPPFSIVTRTVLLYFIWIMLSVLTIKETFQALDNARSYLSSLDNILVWPVIIGSFIVTVSGYCRGAICPWEYHMTALIILFSWLELLLLIGRFPLFGLYVHMFAQVTKNFGKFLFTYICLINAFSSSFGILFHNQPPFKHRFVRLLKTLVMMTGEIEYNEWFYESKREERILYEGTSHLVFAMFLIFGTIILMNLLVGLAVSDIQGLQKSAGLDRLVRQTELIAHFEGFMFSRWLIFLTPVRVLNMIHSRILLLNSMYGSIFILNTKTFSSTRLPPDVIENIKRMARNRDHFSRRRNAFAEFRTLSNSAHPSGSTEGDISRGIEAIKCGIDVLIWETEDHHEEMITLTDKISTLNAILLELRKKKVRKNLNDRLCSDRESNFISCQSNYSGKSSIRCSKSSCLDK